MRLMVINGSLGGASGNTSKAIELFCAHMKIENPASEFDLQHLADGTQPLKADFQKADAFLFTSGVYWDSWGSPLQAFFENFTSLEGDPCFFGKPAGAMITMHSVGGKEVLSRLQGVLNTFGLFTPPMSAMTYSYANQVALQTSESPVEKDLWCLEDLQVLAKNLSVAHRLAEASRGEWASWPVDREDPRRIWIETVSP